MSISHVIFATDPHFHRLTVSLFSEDVKDFDSALKSEARALLKKEPSTSTHHLEREEILGEKGCIYIEISKPESPSWGEILRTYLTENGSSVFTPGRIKKEKSGIVLIKEPESQRIFAFTFGDGRYLLEKSLQENSFGMRVVFNALSQPMETSKTLVKSYTHYTPASNNPFSKSISYAHGAPVVDDINQPGSVLSAATIPKTKGPYLRFVGPNLYWPYKLTAESISGLPEECSVIYKIFKSEDYKVKFGVIDNMSVVKAAKKSELDGILLEQMNAHSRNWYLAEPDLFLNDSNESGNYSYFFDDKTFDSLEGLFDHFITNLPKKVTLSTLKKIVRVKDECGDISEKCRLYDALVFETEQDGNCYVLNSGKWFRINKDYIARTNDEINRFFILESSEKESDKLLQKRLTPVTLEDQKEADARKTAATDKKKENGTPSDTEFLEANAAKKRAGEPGNYLEDIYNKRVAQESEDTLLLMDRRLVYPEKRPGGVEIADLLSIKKHIIHVKDWRGSSTFSHLFSQGVISGQILRESREARSQAKTKYVNGEKTTNDMSEEDIVKKFDAALDVENFKPGDYTIVYAFFHSETHKTLSEYLPIFSRMNLINHIKILQKEGFNVVVKNILKVKDKTIQPKKSSVDNNKRKNENSKRDLNPKKAKTHASESVASSSSDVSTASSSFVATLPISSKSQDENLKKLPETSKNTSQKPEKKQKDIRKFFG